MTQILLLFGRCSTLLFVTILAGCAAPGSYIGATGLSSQQIEAQSADQIEVFIATSRKSSDELGVFYSGKRGNGLSYAKVDVSIPPNHSPGEIETPTSTTARPASEFVIYDPLRYKEDKEFLAAVNTALASRSPADRDILMFIHGFNTNMTNAILRMAQFVEDTGFKGVPVVFSWPSQGLKTHYVYDINSALHSRDKLEDLALLLDRSTAKRFYLVAHSMGTFLTMETIRQVQRDGSFERIDKLESVILAAPDIDIELFETQIEDLSRDARKIYILRSEDDQALRISTKIAGDVSRLGLADLDRLEALGVNVVDLTQIKDRDSIHHTKFAQSPDVVRLIGQHFDLGSDLNTSENGRVSAIAEAASLGITVRLSETVQ